MKLIHKKQIYKSSILEDLLIGIAVLLVGYFYYYENKKIVYNIENPENINYIIKIIAGVFIIAVWMMLSYQNGMKKRPSFLLCTLFIWIIPQVLRYLLVEISDSSIYTISIKNSFILLTKYLSSINYLSLKTLGDLVLIRFDIPYVITLNMIILIFIFMFIVGFLRRTYFYHIGDGENEKHDKTTQNTSSAD